MSEQTYAQRDAATKAQAASILKESAPRTDAEQAAIDALDKRRWVLWHADDYSLGVIRLLSCAGLLRDKAHEEQQAKADTYWTAYSEQQRAANLRAVTRLDALAEQAADRLDKGDDPAEVSRWMRATREAISQAREAAGQATVSDLGAVA